MPLILPGNVASAIGGAYEVANSCRFNDDDDPYMHKTPGGAGNVGGSLARCLVENEDEFDQNIVCDIYQDVLADLTK